MATIRVTQRRSSSGSDKRQLDTLRSLGLRRIGHTVEIEDCEPARGMVHAVRHLVESDPEVRSPKGAPKRAQPDGHALRGPGKQAGKQEQGS